MSKWAVYVMLARMNIIALRRLFVFTVGLLIISCPQSNPLSRPDLTNEEAAELVLSYAKERLSEETLENISKYDVYYSLTTDPDRLTSELPYVLKTLLADTGIPGVPKKIFISIPHNYRNDPELTYSQKQIDKIEKMDPRIQILRKDFDYGPASKLLSAVDHLKEHLSPEEQKRAMVLTFDDDTVYSPALPAQLIKFVVSKHNSVVAGGCGRPSTFWGIKNFPGRQMSDIKCHSASISNCDVVEGFYSVAYPLHLVNSEQIKKVAAPPKQPCRLSDDLVISYVHAAHGTPRFQIENKFTKNSIIQLQAGLKKGLHKLDSQGNVTDSHQHEAKYQKCYNETLSKLHD